MAVPCTAEQTLHIVAAAAVASLEVADTVATAVPLACNTVAADAVAVAVASHSRPIAVAVAESVVATSAVGFRGCASAHTQGILLRAATLSSPRRSDCRPSCCLSWRLPDGCNAC